jgi:hypothetical protein
METAVDVICNKNRFTLGIAAGGLRPEPAGDWMGSEGGILFSCVSAGGLGKASPFSGF